MFDAKHYVPVLKTKAGEMWSLSHLAPTAKAKMTPLFEMHRHAPKKDTPPKGCIQHVGDVCDTIAASWGTSDPFFLDTEFLWCQYGRSASMIAVLEACRNRQLKVIPVVRIGYDDNSLDVVKNSVHQDRRGCMLRLDFEDVSAHPAIRSVMQRLDLPISASHLMLDYRQHGMDLAEHVPQLMSLNEWLTFTATSAAFPKNIRNLPSKIWNEIPRHDWTAWEQAAIAGKLERLPTFSDHATRCCGKPAEGGDPIVHLRYAKERKWIVYKDGTLHSGNAQRMKTICRKLIALSDYDGPDFSEGDKAISRVANKDITPGGGPQWTQWGISHHLAFAVKQLQAHTGI